MNYNNYLKDEDDEGTVDVEVYNIIPDDIRSRLGILDLEDEDDLHEDMVTWYDNADTSKWYYLAVQEATNSHYYFRKLNGFETWIDIREVRDWTELEG